ncbi:SUMF1/EgtB/PvdO family nonheme iron enzyme [Candidatus Sumerlaeota bacterium]|nr:SUMF1/EgtB/PvdO family nonheme iron enzyme [Candidatus Sumerlaeota bacterium]
MRSGALILLSLVTCVCPPWGGAQSSGDVNGNGIIDQPDVEMLRDHLLQSIALSASQALRADCNGQSGIGVGDLVWIVNHLGTAPGPDMIAVPAGSFSMGDPWGEGYAEELPVHTVTLSAYEIGRFEVTNAEYAAFLNSADVTVVGSSVYLSDNSTNELISVDTVYDHSQIIHSGGSFSVNVRDNLSMGDHPVVLVTWHGAAAFCNWLSRQRGYQEVYTESGDWPSDLSQGGYHLPTEAQWERAAAWEPEHGHWRYGYTDDSIDPTRANYSLGLNTHVNPLNLTDTPYTSPVGHFSGASGTVESSSDIGCFDMSGNVWEWCNDWYSETYYGSSPTTDPEGPSPSFQLIYRVIRGGSWAGYLDECRSARRVWGEPQSRSEAGGFRIARNP